MEENSSVQQETKFCRECGQKIARKAVICPLCGCQVDDLNQQQNQNISVNNINSNATIQPFGKAKDKWISFFLCFFIGFLGAHKFYEGNIGLGILYLLTFSFCGVGWFIDTIILLLKPNPYHVY